MKTFLIIVFAVLPACGLIHVLRTYLFARTALRTNAKIIGYDEQEKEVAVRTGGLTRTRVFRFPIVRFKTRAGATHTVTMRDERPKADRASENEIAIIYPKNNPKRARIAHWHALYALPFFWFAPALAILIALLFFKLVALVTM